MGGKTFLGDYLQLEHGFVHIDGDTASHLGSPTWSGMTKCLEPWFTKAEACDPELWEPFYGSLCEEASRVAAECRGNVVVTMLVLHRQVRDFIRQSLVTRGGQSLIYIHLDLPDTVHLQRQYERALRAGGPASLEEMFNAVCPDEEFSPEAWQAIFSE